MLLILLILYCLLITYLNGRDRKQYFSLWSPCFGFFVCPCYNTRTHYPTLEKLGFQNVSVCENQGKQHKLSDHWKHKKMLKKKITGDNAIKTKRLTQIQVLTKKFTKQK